MRLDPPAPGQDVPAEYFPGLHDHIFGGGLVKGDGQTTSVSFVDGGYFVRALPRRTAGDGVSGDTYLGHFLVTNTSDDTTQKIKVIDGRDKTLTTCGLVTAGLQRLYVPTTELTIGATGYVFLKLVDNNGTYVVTIEQGVNLPGQVNGTFYRGLAFVMVTSGKISLIQQLQYGDIEIMGRAV